MSRPALASIDDLTALTGAIATEDTPRASVLLAMASEIVRAYAGVTWLNDDGDELGDVPSQIPDVVASMVWRATSNPLGVVQETAGPFSRSFGADAAQRLYMTKQERAIVRVAAGVAPVGPMGTTRGALETRAIESGDGLYDPPTAETDPFSLA